MFSFDDAIVICNLMHTGPIYLWWIRATKTHNSHTAWDTNNASVNTGIDIHDHRSLSSNKKITPIQKVHVSFYHHHYKQYRPYLRFHQLPLMIWPIGWYVLCRMPLLSIQYFIHKTEVVNILGKTSYRKNSWSLEAVKFGFKLFQWLWNWAGTSAALLPMCLSNFRAIRPLQHPISWLRDFTRFGGKTSYRLVNRGPVSLVEYQLLNYWTGKTVTTRVIRFVNGSRFRKLQELLS